MNLAARQLRLGTNQQLQPFQGPGPWCSPGCIQTERSLERPCKWCWYLLQSQSIRRWTHLDLLGQLSERESALRDCSFDRHLASTRETACEGMPSHEKKMKQQNGKAKRIMVLISLN